MTSFLSDAKARIQHTNKLSLAPKDIKHLADIISTEKNVVSSSSKLSVDFRKAADALKEWGLNQGDDLADIMPKLSILLGHLADAQARFSDHDSTYRIHFKSIRMREESLTTLKKSREAIQAKITALEKKITKMSSENKDLPSFTTRLQESRSELVSLENSVSIEEARLSDFKRETVREGLGLRLGAMLELAEKMTIICEFGKMLAAEVPVERTPPGASRTPYYSANKTQAVVDEAQRCLTQVVFNHVPSVSNLGSDAPSVQSPSLNQDSVTPQQSAYLADPSQSLPMDLPPLYFGDGPLLDKSSSAGGSPNRSYGPSVHQRQTTLHNHNSLPQQGPRAETSSLPGVTSHTTYNLDVLSSPPLPTSQSSTGSGRDYVENVFHVAGSDGVPLAPSSAHTAEPTNSHNSPHSKSINQNCYLEASRNLSNHHQPSYSTSPRGYPSSFIPADSQNAPPSGSPRQDTVETTNNDKTSYSPHPRKNSLPCGISYVPNSEGRTTNAGAFRRPATSYNTISPPTSNGRLAGSDKSLISTDETLSTGTHTTVQPLQISKRETFAGDHR